MPELSTTARTLSAQRSMTANGMASYDIANADDAFVFVIVSALQKQFPRLQVSQPVVGLEGVYIDAVHDTACVTIGWDIWTGCFVFARNIDANAFLADAGDLLDDFLPQYTTNTKQ